MARMNHVSHTPAKYFTIGFQSIPNLFQTATISLLAFDKIVEVHALDDRTIVDPSGTIDLWQKCKDNFKGHCFSVSVGSFGEKDFIDLTWYQQRSSVNLVELESLDDGVSIQM